MADTEHTITMPQLGETVTEGTITRWFKAVGDKVDEDEPLFEVSTDKVDSEVPSSVAGYLTKILVAEGDTVDVGVALAVIADSSDTGSGGATPSGPQASADEAMADGAMAEDAQPPAPEPVNEPTPHDTPTTAGRLLSPLVRRMLAENRLDVTEIAGTGADGRITRADVTAHLAASSPAASSPAASSPAASSPAASSSKSVPATPTPAPSAVPSIQPAATARTVQGDQVVAFSNIRRRTAEHMVRSQATSAHVLVVAEVDFANVDRVRVAEKEKFKADEGFSLTYLPFVARAAIDAIRDFPHLNASVEGDTLVVHRAVNLGIAVDLNFAGLIVPVIADADAKRLRNIAREVADLAARARSRQLNADEISGSTFTITNPGSFGTFFTAPVINQPQVAILSTDGVRKRPVVIELEDGTDAIVIHPVGMLALSFDHRAFDGAYASAFLARCRQLLETRDWSQEL